MRQLNKSEIAQVHQVIEEHLERLIFENILKQLGYVFVPEDHEAQYEVLVLRVLSVANTELWHGRLMDVILVHLPANEILSKIVADMRLSSEGQSNLQALTNSSFGIQDLGVALQNLLKFEQQICCIEVDSPSGEKKGTGFLVGADMVMTNYHVVEDLIDNKISANKVVARFDFKTKEVDNGEMIFDGTTHLLHDTEPVIAFSPYDEIRDTAAGPLNQRWSSDKLDFALLKLAKEAGQEPAGGMPILTGTEVLPRGWIPFPSSSFTLKEDDPLIILQHPEGAPISWSIGDKAVIGRSPDDQRVRYRVQTRAGSSGSPCFDKDWKLVALHHAGDPNFFNPGYNQGIPINEIVQFLINKNLKSKLSFDKVLLEPIKRPAPIQPAIPAVAPNAQFDSVYINKKAPFIHRKSFLREIKGMVGPEPIKVLLLNGERRSGLTYSYHFIKKVADKNDFRNVHLPLKTLFSQEGIADSLPLANYLISKMGIDYKLPDDEEFKLMAFFSTFSGIVSKLDRKFLIFIDDLATFPMTTNCINFIISLAQTVENELPNTRLILAGFKESLPNEILDVIGEATLYSFTEKHIDSFFKSFYQVLPTLVDKQVNDTQDEFVERSKTIVKSKVKLEELPNVEKVGQQVKKYCRIIINKLEDS